MRYESVALQFIAPAVGLLYHLKKNYIFQIFILQQVKLYSIGTSGFQKKFPHKLLLIIAFQIHIWFPITNLDWVGKRHLHIHSNIRWKTDESVQSLVDFESRVTLELLRFQLFLVPHDVFKFGLMDFATLLFMIQFFYHYRTTNDGYF